MGTEILKSFGTLQSELEQARSSLKGVDESIKRLIGRDPSEIAPRPGLKRVPQQQAEENRGRQRSVAVIRNNRNHENDEPLVKRRNGNMSVFKRLSDRPVHYEEAPSQAPQKQMISKVIVTPREVPSRQEAMAAQSTDEKSKARNRRMFGALLGTLQKFQQEETKLKQKEEKRAQVEKKIEEHEIKEKAEIKKERQELFFNRKKKQAEIKMIELKMVRMKEYAAWEEKQKQRMHFIQTKAKPQICYLPRRMNDTTKELLETCRNEVERSLDKKRQEVFEELQHIEERMKKNFEPKRNKEEHEKDVNENNENNENEDNVNSHTECDEPSTETKMEDDIPAQTDTVMDTVEEAAPTETENEVAVEEATTENEVQQEQVEADAEVACDEEMNSVTADTQTDSAEPNEKTLENEVNEVEKMEQ